MVSMRRDGRVHRIWNGRTAAAFDTTSQGAFEVSLAMDVDHLTCIAVYDEVASREGAVPHSLVSDV